MACHIPPSARLSVRPRPHLIPDRHWTVRKQIWRNGSLWLYDPSSFFHFLFYFIFSVLFLKHSFLVYLWISVFLSFQAQRFRFLVSPSYFCMQIHFLKVLCFFIPTDSIADAKHRKLLFAGVSRVTKIKVFFCALLHIRKSSKRLGPSFPSIRLYCHSLQPTHASIWTHLCLHAPIWTKFAEMVL